MVEYECSIRVLSPLSLMLTSILIRKPSRNRNRNRNRNPRDIIIRTIGNSNSINSKAGVPDAACCLLARLWTVEEVNVIFRASLS